MTTSDKIAIAAACIALGSFCFTWFVYRQTQHADMLRALQGQKEAVGYMAFTLSEGRLPWRAQRRRELLKSLCLAAVFTGSGRSRVLVYEALRRHSRHHREEVQAIVTSIEAHFAEMRGLTDLARGERRLDALRAALKRVSPEGAA